MKSNIRLLIISCIFTCAIVIMGHTFLNTQEQSFVHAGTVEDYFTYLPVITKPREPAYKIVFASNRDGSNGTKFDIFVMDTNGENPVNLTNTPDVSEMSPIWSPDGTKIAYVVGDYFAQEIHVMNFDGTNKINLSKGPTSDDRSPVWTPDSNKLGFMSDRDDQERIYDVFVVNADGIGLTNLTNSTDRDEWSMDWSSDGTKIVYIADKVLQQGLFINDVVTMNADGSNQQIVYTGTYGFNYSAVWVPGEDKITFNYFLECLAMINSDGTNFVPCFTDPPYLTSVSEFKWDMDGSKMFFHHGNGVELYLYDATTKQTIEITPTISPPSSFRVYSWSPDGTQLVGAIKPDYEGGIFVMNADGGGFVSLTGDQTYYDRMPSWSPVKLP